MDNIKYSFILPYYHRPELLHNTLVSFKHHYHMRDDYEVIIVEDRKNINNSIYHELLLNVIGNFKKDINIVHCDLDDKEYWNPARLYNIGANQSKGDFLVLNSAECFHYSNVLEWFDLELASDPNLYLLCGCKNVINYTKCISKFEEFSYGESTWYLHTVYRNILVHFCSAIRKENYLKIGGFDEAFSNGIGQEDLWFVLLVAQYFPIKQNDEVLVFHQEHGRTSGPGSTDEFNTLRDSNRVLLTERVAHFIKKQKLTKLPQPIYVRTCFFTLFNIES